MLNSGDCMTSTGGVVFTPVQSLSDDVIFLPGSPKLPKKVVRV
jgi:hypothetical protein